MNIRNFFSKKKFQRDGVVTEWPWDTSGNGMEVRQPSLAMKISAVYRCVDILSKDIGRLPVQIYTVKNGYRQVDNSNPINYLLQVKPNERQNAFDFKRNAVIHMLMYGNAYIYPNFVSGDLVDLVLLSPGSCTYNLYNNSYSVADSVNHIYGTFDSDEIIHLKNMSLDGGYNGISTLHYAATVLGIAREADNQQKDMFAPGSTLRGFITGDETVTKGLGKNQDAQLKTVMDRINSEFSSGQRISRLPGTMKFVALSLDPAALQLLDSKRFSVLEICRFFGVHPDKVFSGQSQNYKASTTAETGYINSTLQPLVSQFENEFQAKLIPRSFSGKYAIKFDLDAFYAADYSVKGDYISQTIAAGVYTTNEWRQREGRLPVDGGDQAFMSCNNAPIDSAKIKGEVPTQQPKV
jgi:HK97 family phage portal protein